MAGRYIGSADPPAVASAPSASPRRPVAGQSPEAQPDGDRQVAAAGGDGPGRRAAALPAGQRPSGGPRALAILALVLIYSTYYQVNADSVGVVQRFGRYVRTAEPGPHVKIPLIETVSRCPVQRQLKEEFGFRTAAAGVRRPSTPGRTRPATRGADADRRPQRRRSSSGSSSTGSRTRTSTCSSVRNVARDASAT